MDDIEVLEQKAVDLAINHEWNEAVKINQIIIKQDKANLSAYLRLGFAFLQKKQIQLAKKYYNKAVKLQPKNTVALDNLERIKILEKNGVSKTSHENTPFNPSLFLETPGKTKTVSLVNLGQKNVLAELIVGQKIDLKIKKRRVEMRNLSDEYIGNLPDDLSKRLIYFLKAKSLYSTYIKEAGLSRVVIFIKEERKGRAVNNYASFPQNIQKNLDVMSSANEEDKTDNEEDGEEAETWEKLVNDLSAEEKEEIIDIQTEDRDDEEE